MEVDWLAGWIGHWVEKSLAIELDSRGHGLLQPKAEHAVPLLHPRTGTLGRHIHRISHFSTPNMPAVPCTKVSKPVIGLWSMHLRNLKGSRHHACATQREAGY